MALAMRLSRGGRKKRPFYRIVVADKRMARDGRYIERLGTYNPLLAKDDAQRVVLNEDRIKHWLSEGAEPSYRVSVFLGKAGIIPMPEARNNPQKAQQSEKTKMRIADKEEKKKATAEAAAAAEDEAKAAAKAAVAEPAAEEANGDTVNPGDTPAETPNEQPAETPAPDAPAETPAPDAPAETPNEQPAETPAETEAKKEG